MRRFSFVAAIVVLAVSAMVQPVVNALPGARSTTVSNEVFLGGNYIELGLASSGSFGTSGAAPDGFFGTAARSNIGMSTNPAGFGETPDLRMDYFLPGSPRERWVAGYKKSGVPTVGKNGTLSGYTEIPNTVTNMSSGDNLYARSYGNLNDELSITQDVTFKVNDTYFLNTVTLKNIGEENIDSVRYARSFDPDNTKDQSGQYTTHNEVLFTHEAGDGKAVVLADTSPYDNDPVYLATGSRSPIVYYSSSPSARVSISNSGGYDGVDPYDVDLYDSADDKGTFTDSDIEINIAFDVGTLAPGQTKTVSFYTSLDSRDFDEVLDDIIEDEADDGDNISAETEDGAPNSGDGNGDGTADKLQSNVSSLPNSAASDEGAYVTLQTEGCTTITSISMNGESSYGDDDTYDYPVGLADFTVDCESAGDTATITLYYDKAYDTSTWAPRKFLSGNYVNLPDGEFGTAEVGGATVTTLTYTIEDGGLLDADGEANGTIVDPAGPGSAILAASTTPGQLAETGSSMYLQYLLVLTLFGIGLLLSKQRA